MKHFATGFPELTKIKIKSTGEYDDHELQLEMSKEKIMANASPTVARYPSEFPSGYNNFPAVDYLKIESIENEDFDVFEKIKREQNNQNKEFIISKSNINENTKLEIYKSTIRPTSYVGLQGKKYKTLLLENNSSFVDTIMPNIKYTYRFYRL